MITPSENIVSLRVMTRNWMNQPWLGNESVRTNKCSNIFGGAMARGEMLNEFRDSW